MNKTYFKVKLNEYSQNPGLEIIIYPPDFRAYEKISIDTMKQISNEDAIKLGLVKK